MIDADKNGARTGAMSEAGAANDGAFVPRGCQYSPEFHWLCVFTEHGQEILADQHIRALGLCTWLPALKMPGADLLPDAPLPVHLAGRFIRPLFPRYLFVQADLDADLWRSIYSRPGVDTILGTRHERPASVPAGALAVLWRQCSPNGVIYPPVVHDRMSVIAAGTAVTLLADGPFAGLTGICRWPSGARVAILLRVLGGDVHVSVAREDVAPE